MIINTFSQISTRLTMSNDGWSKAVNFRAVCDFLEVISNEPSKPKKKEKAERFLAVCRSTMEKSSAAADGSLFPIIR